MTDQTNSHPSESGAAHLSLIQRYPLASFFALAFAFSWLFLIADALGSHDILPFRVPIPGLIVMGYGPTFAALLTAALTEGRDGVRRLLRRLVTWRVGWQWYAFAVFGMGVVFFLSIQLSRLISGAPSPLIAADFARYGLPEILLVVVVFYLIAGLVNGEEMGWRGYALPRMQARWGALKGSVVLGVIWTAFHLPLFWTVGSPQASMPFLAFLASTVALAILFTWMYNNTRGSVLLAILLHASANTWSSVLDIAHTAVPSIWLQAGLLWLVAAIVIVVYGPARLSRRPVEATAAAFGEH